MKSVNLRLSSVILGCALAFFGPLLSVTRARAALPGTAAPKDPNAPVPDLLPLPVPSDTRLNDPARDGEKEEETRRAARRNAPDFPTPPEQACLVDADFLCGGASGHALHVCLAAHLADLSRTCVSLLRPYINARIAAGCRADARVVCLGVAAGQTRACLLEMKPRVGVACRSALELWPPALEERPAKESEPPRSHTETSSAPRNQGGVAR